MHREHACIAQTAPASTGARGFLDFIEFRNRFTAMFNFVNLINDLNRGRLDPLRAARTMQVFLFFGAAAVCAVGPRVWSLAVSGFLSLLAVSINPLGGV